MYVFLGHGRSLHRGAGRGNSSRPEKLITGHTPLRLNTLDARGAEVFNSNRGLTPTKGQTPWPETLDELDTFGATNMTPAAAGARQAARNYIAVRLTVV